MNPLAGEDAATGNSPRLSQNRRPLRSDSGGRASIDAGLHATHLAIRAAVVAASVAYLGTLQWSYANLVSPLFRYQGAIFDPAGDGSLALAAVACVAPAFWLPVEVSRPSQVILWMLYVVAYVPSILIPYDVLRTGFDGVFPLTLAIFSSFVMLSLMQTLRMGRLESPINSERTFENLVLALAVAFGAYVILAFGFTLDLPNIGDVYGVRAVFANEVATSGLPFIAYIVDWSFYVLNPLLILFGIRSRRPALLLIGIAMELLVYGITGYRSALFTSALTIPLFIVLSMPQRRVFGLSLPVLSTAMILGAAALDELTGSILGSTLLVRRLLTLPGQLVADYYEFFSHHPTYGLSHSILGFLIPRPYDLGPPNLIGAVYFGNAGSSANANLWADAFANFGIGGILGFTFVFGLVLLVLDAAASGRDLRVTGVIACLMAVVLSNSGLLTTILTHGLGFALLLILLMPRELEKRGLANLAPTTSDQSMAES